MDLSEDTSSLKRSSHIRGFFSFITSLSPFERLLAVLFATIFFVSGLIVLSNINEEFLVEIPRTGGMLTEGVVGSPRFINPLLAISDADKDLSALVYAGLMAYTPEGTLEPLLARSYAVMEEGTVYRFMLRDDATFHDGTPVTADDVVFTVLAAQNPALKSPKFVNWDGVVVRKINNKEVEFVLKEPFAPFLNNTTIGILPKHIWENVAPDEFPFSQFNIEPVGAGPYTVDKVDRDSSGIPEAYRLSRFEDFARGAPHIENIVIRLYRSEADAVDALLTKEVGALGSVPPQTLAMLSDDTRYSVHHPPLLRIFGVFFNHNRKELFLRTDVREALNTALPRSEVIDEVLGGYGTPLEGPLPPTILPDSSVPSEQASSTNALSAARAILEERGWSRSDETGIYEREMDEETVELSLTLSTANTPELLRAGEIIADAWRTLGVAVELKAFDATDLTQNIIRPRRYDALLFGEVVGRELDLYAFWHSSQRNDPGLNIALYANISADKLLEDARTETDPDTRAELFREFDALVRNELPVLFVYSPDFVYLLPSSVENVRLPALTVPSDRFIGIEEWYIETDEVWPFVRDAMH